MDPFSFRRPRPLLARIWHWANAFVITGIILTIFLRKTLFNWRQNAVFIESKMQEAGITITPELAQNIAKGFRNHMWEWHVALGIAFAVLLVVRIIMGLSSPLACPLRTTLKSIAAMKGLSGEAKNHARHFVIVKIGYILFYLASLFMVMTGAAMVFGDKLGLSRELGGMIHEAHEFVGPFIILFVIVHIIGVVRMDIKEPGVISDMINGGPKS